ncbi:hypothetical protein CVT26_008409, partial [Gymnopilus dilepis]
MITILLSFQQPHPPSPSRSRASRRWVISPLRSSARPLRPPSPPSCPIFAWEGEQEVGLDPGPPTLSRQRRAHLPRIEERAGGGYSAIWCPVAVVAAAVAAALTSWLVTKPRELRAVGVMPGCPPAPSSFVRTSGVVAGAVAPRYHQRTPSTSPQCRPLAICEFRTPHVPHLQDESDMGALDGAAAMRVHGRILLCLRMQAGGVIVSPAWRRPRGANRLARSQDVEPTDGLQRRRPSHHLITPSPTPAT